VTGATVPSVSIQENIMCIGTTALAPILPSLRAFLFTWWSYAQTQDSADVQSMLAKGWLHMGSALLRKHLHSEANKIETAQSSFVSLSDFLPDRIGRDGAEIKNTSRHRCSPRVPVLNIVIPSDCVLFSWVLDVNRESRPPWRACRCLLPSRTWTEIVNRIRG
jgi:hypothetical protein